MMVVELEEARMTRPIQDQVEESLVAEKRW